MNTDLQIPIVARVKQAISVLRNGPNCPVCGKKMKSWGTTGLFPAIQTIIDIICGDPLKWVCKTVKPHPGHTKYLKDMKEYEKKMAEIQQIKQENEHRIFFKKKVPKEPKKPSFVPKTSPCIYAGTIKMQDGKEPKVVKYNVFVEDEKSLFPPGLRQI